jgi:hypothetical protein
MFCASGLVFGGLKGDGSLFHVLRSRTRFRRNGGRRVPFSFFARPYSFSAETRASTPVFKFYAPRVVSSGTGCVGTGDVRTDFHVLRARTHFRRYRGRLVPFSCFAHPNSFSPIPRTSAPVFMFYVPGLFFSGTEGVGSRFHVLRAQTHFRRYRWRRIPFSCFARPDSFSAVPRATGPVFMFCAPGLIFGYAECVGSRFHVLRAQTRFRRYRGRRDQFSCFARPDSFSAVQNASVLVFMFCSPGLIFGVFEVVRSRFLVLLARTHFWQYRGCRLPY